MSTPRTRKARILSAEIHPNVLNFDRLPDSARVDVRVVAAIRGISTVTVWRRAKQGLLPAPQKDGGATRWLVGDLRRA